MELDERLIEKVASYRVTPAALGPIRHVPLLFMVGIVGAGKNVLLQRLMTNYPGKYHFTVSHTTRLPRENAGVLEQNGREYHFVDSTTIEHMLDEQKFVEAKVIHFDNIYGTSIEEIKKAGDTGKIAVSDVDVQGVAEYIKLGLNAKLVFLLPPSYDEWMRRLANRYNGNVDTHDMRNRMKSALKEIEYALEADYFYIVINDDLDKTAKIVDQIAHDAPVQPHYEKAVKIAEDIIHRIKKELLKD